MISNTDSTISLYATQYIRVKAYNGNRQALRHSDDRLDTVFLVIDVLDNLMHAFAIAGPVDPAIDSRGEPDFVVELAAFGLEPSSFGRYGAHACAKGDGRGCKKLRTDPNEFVIAFTDPDVAGNALPHFAFVGLRLESRAGCKTQIDDGPLVDGAAADYSHVIHRENISHDFRVLTLFF